jgi:hypothetical protein
LSRSSAHRPEFALLLSCCRWNFSGRDNERPEASGALDWPRFFDLARFHRVQGLAWNALAQASVPPDWAEALAAESRSIAAANLSVARECSELATAFARTGIPLLFLKGLTVAALAYRSPLVKMAWDIDLLVAEADVGKAAAELDSRGYRRAVPAAGADLAKWHARRKESVWSRPEERLHVELHTRLADNRRLVPAIGIDSPRRNVQIAAGVTVPTLAADELFAYLCVHGASSLWFRLKWISDLAGLIDRLTEVELEQLYARSQELGAGRAAGQALLLADRLFGTLGDSRLRDRLVADAAVCRLAEAAFRQVAGRAEPREPTATPLGTWRIHWTQLLLLPGPRFALGEAARQLRDALA